MQNKPFLPLSGSALKLIASVSMLVDHIAAGLYLYLLRAGVYLFGLSYAQSMLLYRVLRSIGRTAFPIYCFLLIEGFLHTRSRVRYLLSMLLFAVLSELPFDLALVAEGDTANTFLRPAALFAANGGTLLQDQNVLWTLAIGLCVIWGMDCAARRIAGQNALRPAASLLTALAVGIIVLSGMYLADIMKTDYASRGVLLISLLYVLRRIAPFHLLAGYVYFSCFVYFEQWSLPGFLFCSLYNGRRGGVHGRMKYLFYAFYPAHLLLIYLIRAYVL